MHELELKRDRFQPVSREVDEEEETEVVPQLRIDRVVVQEVPEVIGTWRSRPWNTCAEWPAISVAPPSSRRPRSAAELQLALAACRGLLENRTEGGRVYVRPAVVSVLPLRRRRD